ncbi:MAG: hypothetical protein AABZ00_12395 [Chloroflexota bacterium]
MADNPNTPLFADRYRFEPVANDWDRGRSGYTRLVNDLKENRLGVIKRAETISKQSTEGLKNEIKALKTLKGLGVPEVYDTSQTMYGSKNYDYMVIEYIDAIRVEKNLGSLSIVERAEIITKLFRLLSQAHQKGIVNGDVDLKHLFWRTDKKRLDQKELIIIDWGNAKLSVDPRKKTDFAYDLARAAEIIFSLVTRQGHPPATGTIALPDDTGLIVGIGLLPLEFRKLSKWAPRTPSDSAEAPYTAKELYEISKEWLDAIKRAKPYKSTRQIRRITFWGGIIFIAIALFIFFLNSILPKYLSLSTPTLRASETATVPVTNEPYLILTISPTIIPTETVTPKPTETVTSTPSLLLPSPGAYSSLIAFNKTIPSNEFLTLEKKECWENNPLVLFPNEGFTRRTDQNWRFEVGSERSVDDIVQVDFSNCFLNKQVDAVALNIEVTKLEPKREFGFFLEGQNGQRREYTFWLDEDKVLSLRIREDDKIWKDYELKSVVNAAHIKLGGNSNNTFPFSPYYQFPVQIFIEIDNQSLDIIYLLEGKSGRPLATDMDPKGMIGINETARPTLGQLQKVGIIGRGGQTKILIWPFTTFTRK